MSFRESDNYSTSPQDVPSTNDPPVRGYKTETEMTGTRKRENHSPKRPLSAYNFYFREQRAKLLQIKLVDYDPNSKPTRRHRRTYGRIPFVDLVQQISSSWKEITPEIRAKYDQLAQEDNTRYYEELKAHNSLNDHKVIPLSKKSKNESLHSTVSSRPCKTSMSDHFKSSQDPSTSIKFAKSPQEPWDLIQSVERCDDWDDIKMSLSHKHLHVKKQRYETLSMIKDPTSMSEHQSHQDGSQRSHGTSFDINTMKSEFMQQHMNQERRQIVHHNEHYYPSPLRSNWLEHFKTSDLPNMSKQSSIDRSLFNHPYTQPMTNPYGSYFPPGSILQGWNQQDDIQRNIQRQRQLAAMELLRLQNGQEDLILHPRRHRPDWCSSPLFHSNHAIGLRASDFSVAPSPCEYQTGMVSALPISVPTDPLMKYRAQRALYMELIRQQNDHEQLLRLLNGSRRP